jgi:hypothetical protein
MYSQSGDQTLEDLAKKHLQVKKTSKKIIKKILRHGTK